MIKVRETSHTQLNQDKANSQHYFLLTAVIALIYIIYVLTNNLFSFPYWIIALITVYYVSKKIKNWLDSSLSIIGLTIFSYLLLSIIGLITVTVNNYNYGSNFSPYLDDQLYFDNITRIVEDHINRPATLYEYFMSVWYFIFSRFSNSIDILDLLPINWAIGALVISLSYQLVFDVTQRTCPFWLFIAATIGNVMISNTVVNLYRDGLVLFLSLISILITIRKKYIIAFLILVVCGFVRAGNSFIGLSFIALSILTKIEFFHKRRVAIFMVLLILLFSILALDKIVYLGKYGRSFLGSNEQRTLSETIKNRSTWLSDPTPEAESNLTVKLFNMGIIGWPLMPFASLFAPIRIQPLFIESKAVVFNHSSVSYSGINWQSITSGITILLWVLVGPHILKGLFYASRGTAIERNIFAYFILALLAVTFVSFVDRHRAAFIIIYPVFITISYYYSLEYNSLKNTRIIRFIFLILVIFFNIFFY